MRSPRTFSLLALLGFLLMPPGNWPAGAQEGAADAIPRKTAIFVQNVEPKLNSKVPFLEDLVASRVGGKDFAVISRADVLNAVKTYSTEKPAASDRNALGTKLDQLLSDNSSALRLAQNMGADFILFVSIGSLEKSTRKSRTPPSAWKRRARFTRCA